MDKRGVSIMIELRKRVYLSDGERSPFHSFLSLRHVEYLERKVCALEATELCFKASRALPRVCTEKEQQDSLRGLAWR